VNGRAVERLSQESDVTNGLEVMRLAERYLHTGRIAEAERLFLRVLSLDENHFGAAFALGMLYHEGGRDELAMSMLKNAVARDPRAFAAVLNLGVIERKQGLLADARRHLHDAIRLDPTSAHAQLSLAQLLVDLQDPVAATAALEYARSLDEDNPEIAVRLGQLLAARGRNEEAVDAYRSILVRHPQCGEAHYGLSLLGAPFRNPADIERMAEAIRSPITSTIDSVLLRLALARVHDELGNYPRAFAYLETANDAHRASYQYSIAEQARFFARHADALNPGRLETLRNSAIADATPIFVLGMPRSGTSLVEQILASHPQVHGAGEIEYSSVLVEAVEAHTGEPFPTGIERVPAAHLRTAAQAYVDRLRARAPGAARVVDKLPHNFLRIGLLAGLMPRASIVLCERDPMDTCLSIYQHYFSPAHGYAANLTELGHYYRLYAELMSTWQSRLPGRIHCVVYEDLIVDAGAEVARLLEHCGLPWDNACLSFFRNARTVMTPSAAQVRNPLYSSSVGRWRHYQAQLQPLARALSA
jgi:tetratricopeptide (TPR) repeat protein